MTTGTTEAPPRDASQQTGALPVPSVGSSKVSGGGMELAATGETAAAAAASHARAMIEAKFTIALHRPRSMDQVRVRMLQHCKRPAFAELSRYALPRGGKQIRGWSIRFAEAALRELGNIHTAASVVYDDDRKRLVRIEVTDLESNTSYDMQVMVAKTVERKTLKKGQQALSERENSSGELVFLVEATEDDLAMKQNSIVSKALRTCGLRLMPADILDECLKAVRSASGDTDRETQRKKVADGFAELGVMPEDLERYLGCKLAAANPVQIQDLRELFVGVRDGTVTWATVMEEKGNGSKTADTGGLSTKDLRGKGKADKK